MMTANHSAKGNGDGEAQEIKREFETHAAKEIRKEEANLHGDGGSSSDRSGRSLPETPEGVARMMHRADGDADDEDSDRGGNEQQRGLQMAAPSWIHGPPPPGAFIGVTSTMVLQPAAVTTTGNQREAGEAKKVTTPPPRRIRGRATVDAIGEIHLHPQLGISARSLTTGECACNWRSLHRGECANQWRARALSNSRVRKPDMEW